MNWRKASITAIAKTLFMTHGFDSDRAVAIAFWAKNGRMIDHGYERYWAKYPNTKLVDIPDEDANKLLSGYNLFRFAPGDEVCQNCWHGREHHNVWMKGYDHQLCDVSDCLCEEFESK